MDNPGQYLADLRRAVQASQAVNPRLEYIELSGGACSDCSVAIANDDYSGMSDEVEALVRAGIARIGQHLSIGEDIGFTSAPCAVCRGLAGDRNRVGYLRESTEVVKARD